MSLQGIHTRVPVKTKYKDLIYVIPKQNKSKNKICMIYLLRFSIQIIDNIHCIYGESHKFNGH